jgi:hypothetical protein
MQGRIWIMISAASWEVVIKQYRISKLQAPPASLMNEINIGTRVTLQLEKHGHVTRLNKLGVEAHIGISCLLIETSSGESVLY